MSRKLQSIQSLRGVAAMLVVVLHASLALQLHGWKSYVSGAFQGWPNLGVDLFFVISGVIMTITTAERQPGARAALSFLRGRLIRIVPIYWIFSTVMLLLLFALPALFRENRLDAVHALSSFLFVPVTNKYTGAIRPLVPPGWTLVYEMWFYLILTGLLFFSRRFTPWLVTGFFVVTTVLGLVVKGGLAWSVYTSPLMLEFVIGFLIGTLYRSGFELGRRTAIMVLMFGTVLFACTIPFEIGQTERFFFWGVPSACVVAGAIFLERAGGWRPHPILVALGDSSYSLYLSHYLMFLALMGAVGKIDRDHRLPGDALWIGFILAAVWLGALSYRFLELPIGKWFANRTSRTSRGAMAATSARAE